jgi:hypothetical protein
MRKEVRRNYFSFILVVEILSGKAIVAHLIFYRTETTSHYFIIKIILISKKNIG